MPAAATQARCHPLSPYPSYLLEQMQAVAGAAAAASIRGQGSKSKDLSVVGSPLRKECSEGEKSVEPDSPALARRKRNGKRTAQTTSSSDREAEASEQSVAASESEDEVVTANAKVAAAKKLKKKEKVKVDAKAALLDFTN